MRNGNRPIEPNRTPTTSSGVTAAAPTASAARIVERCGSRWPALTCRKRSSATAPAAMPRNTAATGLASGVTSASTAATRTRPRCHASSALSARAKPSANGTRPTTMLTPAPNANTAFAAPRRRARSEPVSERRERPRAHERRHCDDRHRTEPCRERRGHHAVPGGRVTAVPVVVPHADARPFPNPSPKQMRRVIRATHPGGEYPGGHGGNDQTRGQPGCFRADRSVGPQVRTHRRDRHVPQSTTPGNEFARRGKRSDRDRGIDRAGDDTPDFRPGVPHRDCHR